MMLDLKLLAEAVETAALRIEAQLRDHRRLLEEILEELQRRPIKPPSTATLTVPPKVES